MQVHCEWGPRGLEALRDECEVLIVSDVLSFSTSVDVATSRSAAVYPIEKPGAEAEALAAELGAELGAPRGRGRFSLSPACYLDVPSGTRIVLPSPNGGRLTRLAAGIPVLTGCLRNATAVARRAAELGDRVAVLPAGERWPDGSLRPALEDWLGAGAIIVALGGDQTSEAQAAAALFEALSPRLESILRGSRSGRELLELGYERDITLAAELDVSRTAPELVDGAYVRL